MTHFDKRPQETLPQEFWLVSDHEGDDWAVLSFGTHATDFQDWNGTDKWQNLHLQSLTRGRQQKNGFVPAQIMAQIDPDTLVWVDAKNPWTPTPHRRRDLP